MLNQQNLNALLIYNSLPFSLFSSNKCVKALFRRFVLKITFKILFIRQYLAPPRGGSVQRLNCLRGSQCFFGEVHDI
jgi:hypothetical protein